MISNFHNFSTDSPHTLQNDTTGTGDDDDTLSRTLSENSFMSAMSEHDDFGLVNLHMQVNKPITDSPLLMSSYISHLSQYRCSYWDETVSILRTGIVTETQSCLFLKPPPDILLIMPFYRIHEGQ